MQPSPCLLCGIAERQLPSLVRADACALLFLDAATGSLWLAAPNSSTRSTADGTQVEKWRVSVGLGDPAIVRGRRPGSSGASRRKASASSGPGGAWRGSVALAAGTERLLLGAIATQRLLHVEHLAAAEHSARGAEKRESSAERHEGARERDGAHHV